MEKIHPCQKSIGIARNDTQRPQKHLVFNLNKYFEKPYCEVCKETHKVRILYSAFLALATNRFECSNTWYFQQVIPKTSLQSVQEMQTRPHPFQTILALAQIAANARKHTWYFYQVVRKTSLQCARKPNTPAPFSNNFGACTNRCECSQTHLVFLPNSSKDLTANCARNPNTTAPFSNNFGACTNRCECSQTHLVFLPNSSKDLTANCARNPNTTAPFSNNFGACTNRCECLQTHLVFLPSSSKDLKEILPKIEKYYNDFYRSKILPDHPQESFNKFTQNVEMPKLSDEEKVSLEGYLTIKECQKILETLPNEKSPGEDGFTAEFYKHFFELVGYDLVEGLNAAYDIGQLSISQRRGVITLLPKGDESLTHLYNWRPITLLNVDYKIASKAIAKRIEPILNKLVQIKLDSLKEGILERTSD